MERLEQNDHIKGQIVVGSLQVPTTGIQNYIDPEFFQLKENLNAAKTQLDPFYVKDKRPVWDRFQYVIDTYSGMKRLISKTYNGQFVTNAWLKYYELYSEYDILPVKTKAKFVAFFNAELPGAAVCAYNHYVKTICDGAKFNWFASSLSPETNDDAANGDILGDRYGLYKHNKDKWLMVVNEPGVVAAPTAKPAANPSAITNSSAITNPSTNPSTNTNNGDATKIENLKDFAARVGPKSPVGGVDLYSKV